MPTVDVDQRRVVGARVKAKAVHVTSESEAARRMCSCRCAGGRKSAACARRITKRAHWNQQLDNPTGTNTHNASVASPGAFAGNNQGAVNVYPVAPMLDPRPVRQICHGTEWRESDPDTLLEVNGPVPHRSWSVRTTIAGETIGPGDDIQQRLSRLDYFLLMFPPSQLTLMHLLMNEEIQKINTLTPATHQAMTKGELLKFFGVIILCTKFEFGNRASLWSRTAKFKYIPAPCFGGTRMSRTRFDLLFRCLRCSYQPAFRPIGMAHETFRWMLVDDFVDSFNKIGVILRLKLVKTELEAREDDGLTLGTRVAKYLVEPWARTDRIVCGDSFFASVATAKELKSMGLRFIGVVKNASSHYPMTWLSSLELSNRGDHKGLVHLDNDGNPDMMAFVWVDRERRYFISTCSSLVEGDPHVRNRWRQGDDMEAEPEREELTVPTPKGATGTSETQSEFYSWLAEELIDNSYDKGPIRRSTGSVTEASPPQHLFDSRTGAGRSGIQAHLTPTKRKRKVKGVIMQKQFYQGQCVVCASKFKGQKRKGFKSSFLCSICNDESLDSTAAESKVWLCHSKYGRNCFAEHMAACHSS
ncbi:transposase IS4 [Nitzschia inconspicua]|uniref:Transposase IS4 n=1 Tax=Nitzschia inconspicua TaxID=303405 RepID=A0A9K3PDH6_9STRA|nr:transposase IS4 [Nitzschia inconspicua]KAG7348106.1 transposase IS4 [Nitzschia inconspicua]